ncbi:tetratricopeptide repeat protein [Chryseobacterium indologenes]|uniref:tetratricopeptide repeat protein n=1 Tax=Chryseobacterium indologenes TaxID=253 RepID=UPI000B519ABD|nr:hypothetical protein [Chryseobacterium indologenes]ASE64115.1 hypothetical protein CEQ15_22940 [Chryseobacterium indologenes]VFA43794.1 Uncharacterised protein [Chryseobacterium indologenes]
MIKKLLFILCVIGFIKSYSQLQKLKGEWILDRIVKSDGKNLEINDPRYSMFLFYNIAPNVVSVHDTKFKATFNHNTINLENRTFKYWFEDDYLLLQEGEEVSLLLKPEVFIKKHPEFKPKIEIRNNDSLLIANKIIHPIFNNEKSFDFFLLQFMEEENLRDINDLYFKSEYVLTKDNKITNIQVLDKLTPSYETKFIQALKKAEKHFQNPYGINMLVTHETHLSKLYNNLSYKSDKKLFDIIREGTKYFNENKFEDAIEEFSKLDELQIKDNRFIMRFHEGYTKLGISYLAVGKKDQACMNFKKVGNITDFQVRNFLIDFCK